MESSEKLLKHRNSLDSTFTKFKLDDDNIIDDTKHIIIDIEEIENDFEHCSNKCCLTCFLNRICCFLE